MEISNLMNDELTFKSKISKMGENRIIWIPLALREMIKEFEQEDVVVSIKKSKFYEAGSDVSGSNDNSQQPNIRKLR